MPVIAYPRAGKIPPGKIALLLHFRSCKAFRSGRCCPAVGADAGRFDIAIPEAAENRTAISISYQTADIGRAAHTARGVAVADLAAIIVYPH